MKSVGEIVKFKDLPVNSREINKSTVNSTDTYKKIVDFIDDLTYSSEDIAQTLASQLVDEKSLRFYQILAKENSHAKLLEALSYVKSADHQGAIKTKKVFYFLGILKHWGIKTKFKRSSRSK